MAVLVRDMDRYAPLLEAALDRYGVPYYMDRVESIAVMPLTRFLLHAAGALATGFDRTEVLSFLKCGMTGLSLEELDAFEGYSYVWNISGDGFFTPFRQNPAGYAPREMSAREQEELARAKRSGSFAAACCPGSAGTGRRPPGPRQPTGSFWAWSCRSGCPAGFRSGGGKAARRTPTTWSGPGRR